MKILLFCSNFPKDKYETIIGGVVKNPFVHSSILQSFGHDVTVITDGKSGKWNIEGVNVYGVGRSFLKGVLKAAYFDLKCLIRFLSIDSNNFDVIHIHTGNLISIYILKKIKFIKCPIIYSVHGTSVPELKTKLFGLIKIKYFLLKVNGFFQKYIDKIMWNNSDALISSSKYQILEMKKIYGIKNKNIHYMHNGVDNLKYFYDYKSGIDKKTELNIPSNEKVILFVGRWARKKGLHIILENAKRVIDKIPEIRFVCVLGNNNRDLEYRKEIFNTLKRCDLKNKFMIFENVSEMDLPKLYNMAHVCVFPSLQYESIPTVIYEAMSCYKPIITQNNWGIPEVLNNILLTEEDMVSGKIVDKIIELINDKKFYDSIVKEYKNDIIKFSRDKIHLKYLKIYESVVKR
ncbi:MAG TPA: glycosyltransferase family 4 protein [Candidatus Paceibacterota bacterium]|nr:glycosyltransferase family 4 protein [Candidatus Paceibacterota bacterium]